MKRELSIYQIDAGEIVHVAAHDESEAIGVYFGYSHRANGDDTWELLGEHWPPVVERLADDKTVEIVHPYKMTATVEALRHTLPGACFLCSSEY